MPLQMYMWSYHVHYNMHKDAPAYQYPITVHDGVQTVGYGEHSTLREALPDGTLNDPISSTCIMGHDHKTHSH